MDFSCLSRVQHTVRDMSYIDCIMADNIDPPLENVFVCAALAIALAFVGITSVEMISAKMKSTPEDMRKCC